MTIFKNFNAPPPPPPLPVGPPTACPAWGTDQGRLRILFQLIHGALGPLPSGITTNVLNIGSSGDKVDVTFSAPTYLPVQPTTDATRRAIDLNYLAELTALFAYSYIRQMLLDGIRLNTSLPTGIPAYDDARNLLLEDVGKEGFTSLSIVNLILQPDSVYPTFMTFTKRCDTIKDNIIAGNYNFNSRPRRSDVEESQAIYNNLMSLLNDFIDYESQCLFQFFMPGILPPQTRLMGVGDGGGTTGFFGVEGRGILFFNYSFFNTTSMIPNASTTATFNRVGGGINTVVHTNTIGLDYPDVDPPEDLNPPQTPVTSPAPMFITVVDGTNTQKYAVKKLSIVHLERVSNQVFNPMFVLPTSNDIIIQNGVAGTFNIRISAAAEEGAIETNPPEIFDEAAEFVCIVSLRQQIITLALDAENQFGDDEFVLSLSTKYSDPTATPPTMWRIWSDPDSLAALDQVIALIVAGRTVSAVLQGGYIGKRAIPYSGTTTYKKGRQVFHGGKIYEAKLTTVGIAPPTSAQWKEVHPAYGSGPYLPGDVVVVPDPGDPNKHLLFRAIQRGSLSNPIGNPTEWTPIPVVQEEDDVMIFDTNVDDPAYYPSLRYSFCNIRISNTAIVFDITSFVSPLRSRLDKNLITPGGKDMDDVNYLNANYTTSRGRNNPPYAPPYDVRELIDVNPDADPDLNTQPHVPKYNITLSYLRSFGFWEALKQRINDRATDTGNAAAVHPVMNAAFNNTVMGVPWSRRKPSGAPRDFDAFNTFRKNPDWDRFRWQPI